MCGITGFFQTKQGYDRNALEAIGTAMTRALTYRGPDDGGTWQDPEIPLLLGHRRLSIIDLSAEGHQPKESHSGRYIISYNGEIYNFAELMHTLEELGVRFKGRSDTEVMLAAFERWGINQSLQKLNGMFAFAVWDREKSQLHLVRDRLGKKPLYLGWAGNNFVFGSELKALIAHPDFKKEVSRRALTLYMRYGYVPPPFSIYQEVWQLPAGCRITLDLERLKASDDLSRKFEPYWHLPRVVEEAIGRRSPKSDEQARAEFEELLRDSVKQRMVSDVPLGAFLSGGIDSSVVVAMMQQQSERPVKTFSIGFEQDGFNEAAYAKKVAAHLGTEHHEHILKTDDARAIIPRLPEMYDEPFADVSQIPTHLVSSFARNHVTVALSGDGGDELLGGYLRHYVVPALWKRVGWLPRLMRSGMAKGMTALPREKWDSMVPQYPQFGDRIYKTASLLPLKNAESVYQNLVSQWMLPEQLVIGGSEPLVPLTDPSWQPKGLSFAERMMYGDALSYLPNDVMTKVDRASMAVALEARAPLLDYRLFEYAWSLPHQMKVRNGQGKWLLRQILSKYLPDELFDRPKQGFAVPVGDWLRGPLREWGEELLSEGRLKDEGFLQADIVRAVWDTHQNGQGQHEHQLWTVLMFQSWKEQWIS